MSFVTRAIISLLAGIGAGLIGLWIVWSSIQATGQDPGVAHDAWLLTGIFGPGILVPLAVFRTVSRSAAPNPT